jgi:chemotaxis signal transduction protein
MRQRMSQSQLALEKGFADDPRHTQGIYRARAARLARPETAPSGSLAEPSVLVFLVNSERYAVELQQILEVIAHPNITRVPGSTRELCGVINLRGEIRPVWDTALLLGLAEQIDRPPGCVLLLRRTSRPCGLRVDQIQQIRSLDPKDWQAPAEPSRFAKAITSDMITLLETHALLREEPLG